MTDQEKKILKFAADEPTMSNNEYEGQCQSLAKEFSVTEGNIEDLMNLVETSHFSNLTHSQVFEKALKIYQIGLKA